MKVSFVVPDPAMPRTVYYDLFCSAVRRNSRFVENALAADVCLPAEDIALETNWPRYGNQASAFLRGGFDGDRLNTYVNALSAYEGRLCVVNMHPFVRWPQLMAQRSNVVVADISLACWERLLNPRTISMPALPILSGPCEVTQKSILASFRGIASHPCRESLRAIHDGASIRCEFVDRGNHVGRIDATSGKTDTAYTDLLAASVFAFVPRGDAMFSYRLLEVMSFGCIPVILSDNWVLPFDRTVNWSGIGLHLSEKDIVSLPSMLRALGAQRIASVQQSVVQTYRSRFCNLDAIVETLLRELELCMADDDCGNPASLGRAASGC
jgi:hypothetical protein